MKAIKTNTETFNFHEVTVSTVEIGGKVESAIILSSGAIIEVTSKVQDLNKQHKIACKMVESRNLIEESGTYTLNQN